MTLETSPEFKPHFWHCLLFSESESNISQSEKNLKKYFSNFWRAESENSYQETKNSNSGSVWDFELVQSNFKYFGLQFVDWSSFRVHSDSKNLILSLILTLMRPFWSQFGVFGVHVNSLDLSESLYFPTLGFLDSKTTHQTFWIFGVDIELMIFLS